MNNAPALTVGDRIRLTVEGVVTDLDHDGEVYLNEEASYIGFYPARSGVVSVEIVAPPLKVGDKGNVGKLNPPRGGLLRSTNSGMYVLSLGVGNYRMESGVSWKTDDFSDNYEVVYLPAATTEVNA